MRTRMNVAVGRRLREIRRMLDISPEEMAETLEMSAGHFQKLERGDHAFGLERLKMLREQYGVDLNYLIAGRPNGQDIVRDLVCGTPKETFYLLRQLVDSCEKLYMEQRTEEGAEDEKYY